MYEYVLLFVFKTFFFRVQNDPKYEISDIPVISVNMLLLCYQLWRCIKNQQIKINDIHVISVNMLLLSYQLWRCTKNQQATQRYQISLWSVWICCYSVINSEDAQRIKRLHMKISDIYVLDININDIFQFFSFFLFYLLNSRLNLF